MTDTAREPLQLDADFFADPHALYATLRVEAPVREVRLPRGLRGYVVSRYADVRALLADPRLAKNSEGQERAYRGQTDLAEDAARDGGDPLGEHMLDSDPPDHTRLRRLVAKGFTARRIERLRPRIVAVTDERLDALAAAAPGPVDLLATYALPIPVTVISELLGVRPEDRSRFSVWSRALLTSSTSDDELDRTTAEMAGFLFTLAETKRREPADDLMTALVQASEDEDRLSPRELVSMAFLLLVAGHETTVNLIGNGVHALLTHPDQLAALRADPALLPGAVEEFLRFESPVNLATFRYTTEPVRVGDVEIPEGAFVFIGLAGANRDPDRFPDPGRLDVTRAATGHVAFGHGIHHCLGAPLARLEGEIAIGRLLDRFPDLAPAAAPAALRWRESILMRGLTELPVLLGRPEPGRAAPGVTSAGSG